MLPHLSGVSTAGKVRHHIDRRCLIWELDKRLVFVCSDIEFALHKSAEWRAKLSEFLLCGFIRQVSDVEHLHQGPFCWLRLRSGTHSAVKGQSVLPAGCTRHYRYLGWRLCVSVHSVSHDAPWRHLKGCGLSTFAHAHLFKTRLPSGCCDARATDLDTSPALAAHMPAQSIAGSLGKKNGDLVQPPRSADAFVANDALTAYVVACLRRTELRVLFLQSSHRVLN